MIDDYEFGKITIEGKLLKHDLIIYEGKTADWWRIEGHEVDIKDLKNIPTDIDVLVIGNGASGQMKVSEETIEYMEAKGIEVIVENTSLATEKYNQLLEDGEKVAGAFHLTC